MANYNSELSRFYKKSISERQKIISNLVDISKEEIEILENFGYFTKTQIDTMIENVVGSYQLPFGIASNFKVNNKDYLIPMVIEEPSVVAAASNAAKIARKHGGFRSDQIKSIMIAQVQITNISDFQKTREILLKNKAKILKIANDQDPMLIKLKGGAFDFEIKELNTTRGKMVILHLLVDVLDAMGANVVNTMAEAISPYIEELTQGKVLLRIVSNLAVHRLAKSKATFDKDLLGGKDIVNRILDAYEFALVDQFRTATHNKGIMNGIIALTLATGNDTRAVEAGAHAYASLKGDYRPLTHFYSDSKGNLVGEIEIPLALGIIGGMTKTHPMAQLALKILNIHSAEELCQVAAAVGLAQNLAALKALVSEGIQEGHMKLHARNIAKLAGAPDELIEKVAKKIIEHKKIRVDYAKDILKKFLKEK